MDDDDNDSPDDLDEHEEEMIAAMGGMRHDGPTSRFSASFPATPGTPGVASMSFYK
jgi:hypothetical protein